MCVKEHNQKSNQNKTRLALSSNLFLFSLVGWWYVVVENWTWTKGVEQKQKQKQNRRNQKAKTIWSKCACACSNIFLRRIVSKTIRFEDISLKISFLLLYEEENCAIQSEFGKRQCRRKKSEIQIELDRYKVNGIGLRKKRHCHFFGGSGVHQWPQQRTIFVCEWVSGFVICFYFIEIESSERRIRTQQMWCSIASNSDNDNSKHEFRYYCRPYPRIVGELLEECLSSQRLGARNLSEYFQFE